MFIFVSSVLIGGSHSLPLASWLTFGLSCLLALLYRWWELPRTPSVCSVTDAAPAFALSPTRPLPPLVSQFRHHPPSILPVFHPFQLGWTAARDRRLSPQCFLQVSSLQIVYPSEAHPVRQRAYLIISGWFILSVNHPVLHHFFPSSTFHAASP